MLEGIYAKIIAAVLAVLAVGGTALYIHSLQTKLHNRDQTISILNYQITTMTTAQKNQTEGTTKTVEKVVTLPPEVKTVIQTVHDTPAAKNCTPPQYPENVLESF
jgi:tRNA A37 N6-isopentenylltransferase MiaA